MKPRDTKKKHRHGRRRRKKSLFKRFKHYFKKYAIIVLIVFFASMALGFLISFTAKEISLPVEIHIRPTIQLPIQSHNY